MQQSLLVMTAATLLSLSTAIAAEAPKGPAAKDPMAGVRRIVFTGDSLTDGSAWCDWIAETLRANGYPDLVLHNAGVAGNSTAMLRRRYTKDVVELKPDLVVFKHRGRRPGPGNARRLSTGPGINGSRNPRGWRTSSVGGAASFA